MQFHIKKNLSIWFHEFFCLDFFKFSGPQCWAWILPYGKEETKSLGSVLNYKNVSVIKSSRRICVPTNNAAAYNIPWPSVPPAEPSQVTSSLLEIGPKICEALYLRGRFIISELVWALLCLAIFRSSIGWSGGGPRWWWWWLLDIADDPPWVSLYLFITLTRFVLLLPANICFLLTILWLLLTRPLLVLSRYLVVRSSFSFFTADIRSPNLK